MKTTPEARRTLAALAVAAAVNAGCATTGLDDQPGSSGGTVSGPVSSPAAERVIAGVAQMVLATRAWATFEEAQADPVVKLEDGAPLYAYIRAARPLGELAHPPTPGGNYAFSEYPHLLLQIGEADSLRILGTCYITLTAEEAAMRELVVPLAPLTFRPGQIPADCWLSTVVAGRSGQRTYEVRLAGFAGKFESWLPVPDLLAVTPVPTDLSNGTGEYATMLRATPMRSATLLASTSTVSPAALAPAPSNPAALSAPAWSLSPPGPSSGSRAGMAGPGNVSQPEVAAAATTPNPGSAPVTAPLPAPVPAPDLAASSPTPNLMQNEAPGLSTRRFNPAASDPVPPASTAPGPIVLDSVPPPFLVTLESAPEAASPPPRAFVPNPASYAPAPPYAAPPPYVAPPPYSAAPVPAPAATPMPAPIDPTPMPAQVAATPLPPSPIRAPAAAAPMPAWPMPAPVAAPPPPASTMPASPMPTPVGVTPTPAPFVWNPAPAPVVREQVPAPTTFNTAPNASRSGPPSGARSPFVPAAPSPEGPGFPTLATVSPSLLAVP
ncbi:MAG TPA: hypothetical protein VEY69_01665, partial [Lautropia sp.]|nr:hypothetical protein [Lautropia sp.]